MASTDNKVLTGASIPSLRAWIEGKLAGKANASHTHTGSDITSKVASATNADTANAIAWTGVTDKTSVQVTFTSNGTQYTYDLVTK